MGQWISSSPESPSWCQCISVLIPLLSSLPFPWLPVSVSPLSPCICSDMLFVLPGWVAGLRGGAVQHGPHASQQHPRPEEDDVPNGNRAQGQSWKPTNPLTAQPQPPRTPGSPWTGPPQPHGPSFSRQLSTLGKREGKKWSGSLRKPVTAVICKLSWTNLRLLLHRCYGSSSKSNWTCIR